MAAQRSRSKRDENHDDERGGENGREPDVAIDEGELASYLTERIKPGLNRGAIPLLARSIAREIARDEFHSEEGQDSGDESKELAPDSDLASGLHALQEQLGEDWILSLSVQGDESWLVAENTDFSQRIEATDASVLRQAVKLLNEGGGRSRKQRDSD